MPYSAKLISDLSTCQPNLCYHLHKLSLVTDLHQQNSPELTFQQCSEQNMSFF